MAVFYTEIVKRELNDHGKPRLVSVLAEQPGAVPAGFDGDGTPPKRGAEVGRVRFWEFPKALRAPLPDGVTKLTTAVFDTGIADREAAKPAAPEPVAPEPTLQERFDAASTDAEKIVVLARNAGVK